MMVSSMKCEELAEARLVERLEMDRRKDHRARRGGLMPSADPPGQRRIDRLNERDLRRDQSPALAVTPSGRPTIVTRSPLSSRRLATRCASAIVTASIRPVRRSM